MKTVSMTLEIRTGLPNYSSRTTAATVVADENESLDIKQTVRFLDAEIRAAWSKEQSAQVVERQSVPKQVVEAPPAPPAAEPLEKVCADVVKRGRGRPPKVKDSDPLPAAASEEEFEAVSNAIDDILG